MSDELQETYVFEEDEQPKEEAFLYDDFFVDEADPGVEVFIELKGRRIPIRVASGLSIEDQQAVQQAAIKKRLDLKTGQLLIEDVDEDAITYGLLKLYIKDWPFTYPAKTRDGKKHPKAGQKVPITENTIKHLVGEAYIQLRQVINLSESMKARAADGPFVKVSGKH